MRTPVTQQPDRIDAIPDKAQAIAQKAEAARKPETAEQVDILLDRVTEAPEKVMHSAKEKLEHVASRLEDMRAQARPVLDQLVTDADGLRRRSVASVRGASAQLREQARSAAETSTVFIREKPIKTALIAAAVAAVSMALLRASGRSGTPRE